MRSMTAAAAAGLIASVALPFATAASAAALERGPVGPVLSVPSRSVAGTPPADPATRAAREPEVELRGLPRDFVPGADWQEFTVAFHQPEVAQEFNRVFFQVHDNQWVGLKVGQIEVEYFQDGAWRPSESGNDPSDNWQDYPIPADEGRIPLDRTEIPVRLRFGADSPLADRIDIGAAACFGAETLVEIKPMKIIRLVPGAPEPTATPTATGTPTPTGSPTATGVPTATATPTATGTPSPTATPTATGAPTATGSPIPSGTPVATATAAPTASMAPTATAVPGGPGRPGPSGTSVPAPGTELARTGADGTGRALVAGAVTAGVGVALVLAARAVRARRRRH
ncbi:hypothetical protein AB0I39_33970 [Kitasatospora purpeofusca]|uniref:hypothetical protein n=1 Tax=Kitasatospora purpeofusca TaxID=67352 RepID=UPI0033F86931